MAKAEPQSVRIYEDGILQTAGAVWGEARFWLLLPCAAGLLVMSAIWVGLLVGAFDVPPDAKVLLLLLLAGVIAIFAMVIWDSGYRLRAVEFCADGSIEIPYGYPGRPWLSTINGDHMHITSIEMHQTPHDSRSKTPQSYEVRMFTSGGDILVVGVGLAHWQAHKAAVLLTQSLQDIRRDIAQQHHAGRGSAERALPQASLVIN